ncbi:UEV domain-containing protein [Entamoeba marina]
MNDFNYQFNPIQKSYSDADSVEQDIKALTGKFPKFRITQVKSKTTTNQQIALDGLLPINYKGKQFGIPLVISFTYEYPITAPEVYCKLSDSVQVITNHPQVDENGIVIKISKHWDVNSDIVVLINDLITSFSISLPSSTNLDSHKPIAAQPENSLKQIHIPPKSTPLYPKLDSEDITKTTHLSSPLLSDATKSQYPMLDDISTTQVTISPNPDKSPQLDALKGNNDETKSCKGLKDNLSKSSTLQQTSTNKTSVGTTKQILTKEKKPQPSQSVPLSCSIQPERNNKNDGSLISKSTVPTFDNDLSIDDDKYLEGYNVDKDEVIIRLKRLLEKRVINAIGYSQMYEDYINSDEHYNKKMRFKQLKKKQLEEKERQLRDARLKKQRQQQQQELESLRFKIKTTTTFIEQTQQWLTQNDIKDFNPKQLLTKKFSQKTLQTIQNKAEVIAFDDCIERLAESVAENTIDITDALPIIRKLSKQQFKLKITDTTTKQLK